MKLNILKPKTSPNKAYLKVKPLREEIENSNLRSKVEDILAAKKDHLIITA